MSEARLVAGRFLDGIDGAMACRGLEVCNGGFGMLHPWDVFHNGRPINIDGSCCSAQPLPVRICAELVPPRGRGLDESVNIQACQPNNMAWASTGTTWARAGAWRGVAGAADVRGGLAASEGREGTLGEAGEGGGRRTRQRRANESVGR